MGEKRRKNLGKTASFFDGPLSDHQLFLFFQQVQGLKPIFVDLKTCCLLFVLKRNLLLLLGVSQVAKFWSARWVRSKVFCASRLAWGSIFRNFQHLLGENASFRPVPCENAVAAGIPVSSFIKTAFPDASLLMSLYASKILLLNSAFELCFSKFCF